METQSVVVSLAGLIVLYTTLGALISACVALIVAKAK